MGTRALADTVQALRCGLDEAVWNDVASAEPCLAWLQKPREESKARSRAATFAAFDA